jgi:hypothetical protein
MSKKPYDPLSIPPDARKFGGYELLRAGVAEEGLTMSIRRGFEDPAAWGALLATAGRQVARIYARELGLKEEEVRARIMEMFATEMSSATDPGTITATR